MSPPGETRTFAGGALPPARQAERCRVTVLDGAQAGRAIEAAAEPIRIGSHEGNSLRLDDETVSRWHLEIAPTPSGFLLRDLDARNGTLVDGYRVREIFLPRRAQIRAGAVTLSFEALGEEVPVELSSDDRFGDVLGRSPAMRELFSVLAKVAPRDLTVLLEGESGTGKELLAEAIHARSARASGPYVVFDCASVPASLVESELFGHERGAFTGAIQRRIGRFEEAHGGTLFLDEIGELPIELQPKLLRALEQREVRRVGGGTVSFDVRVLAATNRDLPREVNRGAFREDLYYRLAVVRVRVPPLRERKDDIPLLVEHFVREALDGNEAQAERTIKAVSDESWRSLLANPWPGNVRALKNFLERTLAVSGAIERPAPPDPARAEAAPELAEGDADRPFFAARDELLARFEKSYLESMLARHDGNLAQAARASGLDRAHLRRLLRKHGIQR